MAIYGRHFLQSYALINLRAIKSDKKGMDQIQKLVEQLNLQTIQIGLETQIHIFALTSNEFSYSIIKKSPINKASIRKKYRIQFVSHAKLFKQQILAFINKFAIRKLCFRLDVTGLYEKTEWGLLKQLQFNSIKIYHREIQTFQSNSNQSNPLYPSTDINILVSIIKLELKTEIIEIKLNCCIKQLIQLEQILNVLQIQQIKKEQLQPLDQSSQVLQNNAKNSKDLRKQMYKLSICLSYLNMEQLFQFIVFWCQLKDSFCTQFQPSVLFSSQSTLKQRQRLFCPKIHQAFVSSSMKILPQTLNKLRDQIMVIQFKNEIILSLNSSETHGYSIVLGKSFVENKMIYEVINLVLRSKYFVSLEFQCQLSFVVDAVDLIFKKYKKHCNYLIKIGNHLEITSYRLMLNTTNLSPVITRKILQLMQLPGHYELIFYGTLEYFQALKNLLIKKPLIKFGYFVPVNQLSVERAGIISKMEILAENLRIKVLQFCSLLKDLSYNNIQCIQSIFIGMHIDKLEN